MKAFLTFNFSFWSFVKLPWNKFASWRTLCRRRNILEETQSRVGISTYFVKSKMKLNLNKITLEIFAIQNKNQDLKMIVKTQKCFKHHFRFQTQILIWFVFILYFMFSKIVRNSLMAEQFICKIGEKSCHRTWNIHGMFHKTSANTLHKKCPNSELFWSVFSCIRTEYGEILRTRISSYSVGTRENADQNNSEYGHFSGSE